MTDLVVCRQPAPALAAKLVSYALDLCEQVRLGTAVMLLRDAMDVLEDEDEIAYAYQLASSPHDGDRPEGGEEPAR